MLLAFVHIFFFEQGPKLTVTISLAVILVLKVNDDEAVKGLALDVAGRAAGLGRGSGGGDSSSTGGSVLRLPDSGGVSRLGRLALALVDGSGRGQAGSSQQRDNLGQHLERAFPFSSDPGEE